MLQETEKRNRDFAARMREQREDLKKMTESHLEELTKRTILENEQMSAELQYESRQVQCWCPLPTWLLMWSLGQQTADPSS